MGVWEYGSVGESKNKDHPFNRRMVFMMKFEILLKMQHDVCK